MSVSVKEIASIMRGYGTLTANPEWEKAAKLQDLWFGLDRHVATPVAPDRFDFAFNAGPDQTGITLAWLQMPVVDTDGRAKAAFDTLQKLVLEEQGDARGFIKDQANKLFETSPSNKVELGAIEWLPNADLRAFHAQRVSNSPVVTSPLLTPLDPLLGTLGGFNFYAIPVGTATKGADGVANVVISRFVVYALDSYDFNGPQELGFFESPDQISKFPNLSNTRIENSQYVTWRDSAEGGGKGGDFLVMTDTKSVGLQLSFAYSPPPTVNGAWLSNDEKHRFSIATDGKTADWTETGTETGIVWRKTLPVTRQGSQWRIERPNNDDEVLKMLGFSDLALREAILKHDPHPSYLVLGLQGPKLAAKWSGMVVKKKASGAFDKLVQPEDPANPARDYTFLRN
jgi:hypothetical protein